MSHVETFEQRLMERSLHLVALPSAADLSTEPLVRDGTFVGVIVWDAASESAETIGVLAARILDAGAVYVCAWGSDCERVHNAFDEAAVARGSGNTDAAVIMTTAHADEPLSEALWFALMTAFPDDTYDKSCQAVVAIVIGNDEYATAVRDAFRNPRAFVALDG